MASGVTVSHHCARPWQMISWLFDQLPRQRSLLRAVHDISGSLWISMFYSIHCLCSNCCILLQSCSEEMMIIGSILFEDSLHQQPRFSRQELPNLQGALFSLSSVRASRVVGWLIPVGGATFPGCFSYEKIVHSIEDDWWFLIMSRDFELFWFYVDDLHFGNDFP